MSSPVRHSRDSGNPSLNVITDHLDIWAAAETPKKAGGRGRGAKTKKSPHGIKKLRELILELAVSGKLVPQDPNDEPASVLLEKITAEKELLVKEKKIKKPKKLGGISNQDIPFELPCYWGVGHLGDLSYIITKGTTPTSIGFSFENTGVSFVKIENLDKGRIDKKSIRQFISAETNDALERSKLQAGDLLFSIAGTIGKTCIVHESDLPANTNQALAIIRGTSTVSSPEYLRIQLDSFVAEKTRSRARGGAMPNVSLGDLTGLVLPVPPIAEQHRIVAKVDELMALCDVLEQEQTESSQAHQTLVETLLATLTQTQQHGQPTATDGGHAEHTGAQSGAAAWLRIAEHFDTLFTTEQSIDQLKKTILQLAVMGKLVPQNPNDEPASELLKKIATEKARLIKEKKIKKQKPLQPITEDEKPFELPRDWKWVRLGECVVLKSGTSFPKGRELEEGPVPYCKVGDMNMAKNLVDLTTSSRFIDPDERDLKQLIPAKSIAFPKRGGAIATNKKRYVIKELFVDLNVMVATPINPLSITYVMTWLDGIDLASLNTGTSVPQINNKDIEPLLFPCPPEAEQQRIVAKVDELVSICDTLKARLNESQTTQVQLADAIVERAVA